MYPAVPFVIPRVSQNFIDQNSWFELEPFKIKKTHPLFLGCSFCQDLFILYWDKVAEFTITINL